MTEPSSIKYVRGGRYVDNNPEETYKHVKATYRLAVQLFAKLCSFHRLNPLKDGVIISHSEGYKRGIATNHGDVEHLWNHVGLTMDQFRKDVYNTMNG